MPNPEGDMIWYELMTSDVEGARAFYGAVVGWEINEGPPEFNGYRMITRSDGGFAGGVMPITDDMASHGARPRWLGYVHVADVDAKVAAIEAAGGKAWWGPVDIPNVGRLALVSDPQAAPFYVMKPNPPEGDPSAQSDVFSVDQPQRIRWNELSTTDQDAAIDFYARHFGIRQEGAMDMGEMGEYRFIFKDDVRIGAIMRKPPGLPVSLWSFYVGVDDIDRAARAVTDGGGIVHHGPSEIPGGEFTIIASDPQGAAFGLVGPRKS